MSLRTRGAGRIAMLLVAACAAGCATTEQAPARLHFGMEDAPEGKRILFPPEPEVPRYMYAGQLIGETNFVRPKQEESGFVTAMKWIAGLFETRPNQIELLRPQAGAVDAAGRIFVTDVSRPGVFVFDPVAGVLTVWDKAEGITSFIAPVGIALAEDGGVFVADAELKLVARLDREGNTQRAIGAGVLDRPTGVAYDVQAKRLYVSDTRAHDIKVFDGEGKLIDRYGKRGEGPGEFNFPTFLTLRDKRLYVADTMNARVQVLDAETGAQQREVGQRGLYVGQMVRPKGVALDSEDNLYVVESYYDNLLIFNKEGQFLMPIGGAGKATGQFFLPSGVWVDARDRVFVADVFNGRVMLFQFLGGGVEGE